MDDFQLIFGNIAKCRNGWRQSLHRVALPRVGVVAFTFVLCWHGRTCLLPIAINGLVRPLAGSANRLVKAVLHERPVPDRQHWWMDVHECHSLPQTPTPILPWGCRERRDRDLFVAGRNRNRLDAALADHLLDDRPKVLFERAYVGCQCELAEITIADLQVFVVQELRASPVLT